MDIKTRAKYKGQISARVYRAKTDTWEDLGVISTTKLSLLGRIKKVFGFKTPGKMSYAPLPEYKGRLKDLLPKLNGKEILRVISKSIGEDETTFNCLMDDGSIETVEAGLLEEVQ